ncbi:Retrotransposon protein, putative, Ty1-copia subclass [Quillaja saponaria]|uniref:Retrotransposon protein, putative, Ty1-copia subclass n=1 Tax=Quillaja saponaria TaxID=32244 RepID=A0AAD7LKW6_QUISA|nr:Retrotransposon protein, putative, Ty1-copia subclass [Quillaja saponaria]
MKAVGDRYKVSDNAETEKLINDLAGMRYENGTGVQEFILKMVHVQTKLKNKEIPIPDSFVVHHSLNSLPPDFSQNKTAYNTKMNPGPSMTLSLNVWLRRISLRKERVKPHFLFPIPSLVLPRVLKGEVNEQAEVAPPIPTDATAHVPNEAPQQQNLVAKIPVRRSERQRRPAISDDFIVYLGEIDYDVSHIVDPTTYGESVSSPQSDKWIEAMREEMQSMVHNGVWELVALPEGCRPIRCKWVYKTKKDSKGKIECFKARLVAKDFSQREGVDFSETFSHVSIKDSFRVIMALVAHFNLELHQMDVKTAFLNRDLAEEVYMIQPEGFKEDGESELVCRLMKSIYGLKQASQQCFLKFDEVITFLGFVENKIDQCIYLKVSGSKFIILVLYVDDILLASSDVGLLHETKLMLSKTFDMKDLGEASFVLGIEIHRDRSRHLLGLSQRA